MENRNVIIVGAGIGGLAAGYWFSQRGYRVEILEASNRPADRMAAMVHAVAAGRRVCEWGGTTL